MGKVINITGMVKQLDRYPNRLREWRQARGLTLLKLAEKTGTSTTNISRFETGERDMDLGWMRIFARALGIETAQLLTEEDNSGSLSPEELTVIRAMRSGDPRAVAVLTSVADQMAEPERKRA